MVATEASQLDSAAGLARTLLGYGADEVYLFGSVARDGHGYDIDMVAVVPSVTAARFLTRLGLNSSFSTYGENYVRTATAGEIMGFTAYELEHKFGPIDLYLFPPNWRTMRGRHRLNRILLHDDPDLVTNINREAKRFNPDTGTFET
jgi:predicted nucleotidyltransferase